MNEPAKARLWRAYINPITGRGTVTLDALGTNEPLNAKFSAEDAHLIAAAPTMLAALQDCVEPLEPGEDCPLPPDLYNKVCAAIAAAEGRTT